MKKSLRRRNLFLKKKDALEKKSKASYKKTTTFKIEQDTP